MGKLIIPLIGILTAWPVWPAHAGSTCYLYDGDAYWICLREERADEQALEELREQIVEDEEKQKALDQMGQDQ